MIRATKPAIIQSDIFKAGALTDEAVRCGTLSKSSEKRKEVMESSKQGGSWTDNKREKLGKGFVAAILTRNEYVGVHPRCAKCNAYHPASVPCLLCYNCQKPDHFARDCRSPVKQVALVNAVRIGNNKRMCYAYGSPDHFRNTYPKLNRAPRQVGNCLTIEGNQNVRNNRNQVRGRAFNVNTIEARQDPNVVTVYISKMVKTGLVEAIDSLVSLDEHFATFQGYGYSRKGTKRKPKPNKAKHGKERTKSSRSLKLWEHTMMRPNHQDPNAQDIMKLWKRMGCDGEINDMLRIRLREAGSNDEIITSVAWFRAFNINEPIYAELCHAFYSTYEFDEVCVDDESQSKKIIKFRLGGRAHSLTLLEFARRLGLYQAVELEEEGFNVYFDGEDDWGVDRRCGKEFECSCSDLDTITLRDLIDSNGKLILEDPQPGVPRVGIPRPPRASMQDLYDRMGRMEIRQEGAYNPPGYA
ncbi:reverse transcriptase domain-containing protein [Tanacetum coccineum]|uniref:Reverse transcriptase domain-containing protein n=1 Tax=Tanacetum coccineum TaxID=301880 RepID=A0ABQ5ABE2_9ASTR